MSIYGAMFSGVSAMNANSQAMGVLADNISNLNTIGYKHTESRFSTLVTRAATSTAYSPGGIEMTPVQQVERQGLLQSSPSATDIAISGIGQIVVNEAPTPGTGDRYLYTRAGQFSIDKNGYLVNTGGYFLQAWPTTTTGAFDVDQNGVADTSSPDPTSLTNLKSIKVTALTGTSQPTTKVTLGLTLPATAAVAATENLTVKVFDSLGVAHNMALQWTKTVAAPATWRLDVTGLTLASGGGASTSGLAFPVTVNTVVFNGDGTPSGFTPVAFAVTSAQWTTAAAASSISFNLGTVNKADGVTQFASSYNLSFVDQDGGSFGAFKAIEIAESGLVTAVFDNGSRRAIYKIPIATFANYNALDPVTGNAWAETAAAGNHFLNVAGAGAAGSLSPGTLESSTVDLGIEFTNMIITQRAFSASTKIITTADEMLEELVRIKR